MDPPALPGTRPAGTSPTPCPHDHEPYAGATLERFQNACVSHFDHGEAHVVILRGVLDWRAEGFVSAQIADARRSGRPLVVDLSAVTHLHIDVLAQLLAARRHPGISLLTPLPAAFLKTAEMTGTTGSFTTHPGLIHALSATARPPSAP
ncbi:STAS domain-containing protein [Streptomyces sp. SPB162]|uniref:STAS domain-containing protein n=1 Tax=Streptomyces sp. SPB162 TaxID=2940560 RepID=UPI002405DC2D|nr:STAS domain-containing protein [Streptomyces sp. SPB162]MDF9817066.1 anti-anti-sigma regulatory factor [Streptomyces sp. SPB162]